MNDLERQVLQLIGEDLDSPDVFSDEVSETSEVEQDAAYIQSWELDHLTATETNTLTLTQWDLEEITYAHAWEDRIGHAYELDELAQANTQPWEAGDTDIAKDSGLQAIRDSLNDAIQEMCMVTGSYRRIYHLPLEADCAFYRLDFGEDYWGWVIEAWDRGRQYRLCSTDAYSVTQTDAYWLKLTGPAEDYFQIGTDILAVRYKPSTNGVVLELQCACIPKAYTTDEDPIELRNAFQDAAVYFACAEYYASRGDAARAAEWHKKYLDEAGFVATYPEAAERQYTPQKVRNAT